MTTRPLAALAALLLVASPAPAADGDVLKAPLPADAATPNRLDAARWRPYEQGFEALPDGAIRLDNGDDARARRGASQVVTLNQERPTPIVVAAEARAAGVTGGPDNDFSLYVDLVLDDGTPMYGQAAPVAVGTHDWQPVRLTIVPDRPVRSASVYVLLRGHAGRADFRNVSLRTLDAAAGGLLFDAVPVVPKGPAVAGYQLRDVAAGSGFVRIERATLGVTLDAKSSTRDGATFHEFTLRDTTGRDRALTLVYSIPISPEGLRWLDDPRRDVAVTPGREFSRTTRHAGGTGRLSLYPLGGVASPSKGHALATDPATPAVARIAYNAGTGELFLAYDLALTPERPAVTLRFVEYPCRPDWGFRSALAVAMSMYLDMDRRRVERQGLWMPFAKISKIPHPEDFGFRIKEGNDEVAWDDAHDVLTFRYTEPLTWWMPMPKGMPRTLEAAEAEAKRRADRGDRAARAWLASAMHGPDGGPVARLLDTPWNDGAVWSMNSMPEIGGTDARNDFHLKWNPEIRERFYGEGRKGDLDGEYVDSSEGYVTAPLDFRRDHFAAARTPLTFDAQTLRPAIDRGLVAFEYIRAIADDMHGMGKLIMANGTPSEVPWLAPLLDVLGTETDWNPGGRWRPMSDAELIYRRALCGRKPYCLLMNTDFDRLGPDLVERYMKRALAYGMFPGFFSADAATGHYFSRPELYERDRPLFKKYIPVCRLVAEAGWHPVTGARSSDPRVHVERFGPRPGPPPTSYLTVYNDSDAPRTATITLDGAPASCRDVLRDAPVELPASGLRLTLDAGDVAVLELTYGTGTAGNTPAARPSTLPRGPR
jgi:hypothetical protein